jgi:inward rectifier potassium channel
MRFKGIPRPLKRVRQEWNDLGFGTRITDSGHRLINKDGSFNIIRRGRGGGHLYQSLVEMPWSRFFLVVILYYLGVNALFGGIFYLNGIEHLPGAEGGSPAEQYFQAFSFSVQTFTTVGYGAISPDGLAANMLATFDALTGLMFLALATGLFFARFSKPRAQLIFSKHALIAPYNDTKSFQFRIANLRNNKLIDVEAQLTLTWIEQIGGVRKRQFSALPLERKKIFLFPLNWTIVHPIDQRSPLSGKSLEELKEMKVEFIIQIKGFDETYAQTVHANSSYTEQELLEARGFAPMYESDPEKGTIIHLDKIDDIQT